MKKLRPESGTILVNGEEAVCNVVRQALEGADYRVLEVRDAREALEICRHPMERIDLLLTEVKPPELIVRALVERAAILRPRMKVIYMSKNVDLLLNEGAFTSEMAYLQEPFTETELLGKVREILRPSPRHRQIGCPQCSSTNVRRSQLRWFDWLLTFIFLIPYGCRRCHTRFYRFEVMKPDVGQITGVVHSRTMAGKPPENRPNAR
jgi:DNA-binding response OmpR family regulator